MDYDYRNRAGSGNWQAPGSSLYPRISQQPGHHANVPGGRPAHPHPAVAPPPSELGIRVRLKPEYRITQPPQLAPQVAEVPRSQFNFDFDFEKRIIAEAEKDVKNWNRFVAENPSPSFNGPASDPVVEKYAMLGLGREAVSLAVLSFGDNPIKVREFVRGYNLLREMGFSSKNITEALVMYDNDADKAVAHFLNSTS
ncbi:ubiquitin-associated/translation elongation factor EF1B protein isoform X2 [Wolffia australiana]